MRSILINVSIESNIQDGSGKQQKDGSHGNPIIPRYLVMRHLVETMEMPHFVCLLELNIGAMSEQWTLYDVNDDVIDKKSLITETPKISDVCLMRLEIAQRMNDVIDYVTRSTIRRRRKLGGRSSGSGVGVVTSRSGSSNQLEGDVIGNCLFLSSLAGDTATCERILSSGWNYPITSKYGNTPLHVAAFHGRLDIIRLLVQHQFPIRLENHNGNTAMNLAVKRGFFNVASYLWSHHWMETPFLLPDSSVTLWSLILRIP